MEWKISKNLVPYEEAAAFMEARAQQIHIGEAEEMVWLLEHPPLYTAGTSATDSDMLDARFPVHRTGRGGQYTYHGPGQRIAYVMLDLTKRGQDIRRYVHDLEAWLINTLAAFGVQGEMREGRVGVWVRLHGGNASPIGAPRQSPREVVVKNSFLSTASIPEAKIAAIGVRVRKWVTFHGIALNVNPDLSHYSGIVPCGVRDHGVTSLAALGVNVNMDEVDARLTQEFSKLF